MVSIVNLEFIDQATAKELADAGRVFVYPDNSEREGVHSCSFFRGIPNALPISIQFSDFTITDEEYYTLQSEWEPQFSKISEAIASQVVVVQTLISTAERNLAGAPKCLDLFKRLVAQHIDPELMGPVDDVKTIFKKYFRRNEVIAVQWSPDTPEIEGVSRLNTGNGLLANGVEVKDGDYLVSDSMSLVPEYSVVPGHIFEALYEEMI